jgi:serine/threonine protein kinase
MSSIDAQISARLEQLRVQHDHLLDRFDRNGDGMLDDEEWAAVRAVVAREVLGMEDNCPDVLLRQRYRLISRIGQGAQGQTYLAHDLQTDRLVAVKTLHIRLTKEWKAVDLFQREVQAIARLNHKGIPAFIDSFEEQNGTELYLVQGFVPGDNIHVRLARNEMFSPERLKAIAIRTLEILDYLHSQAPPVLHRDIKPANLILGANDEVSLVDFGAVQNQGSRGTTIIGTTGYMPPEQLAGRATRASDLYALAATLVHIATQRHPSDLPVERLKLQWRNRARLPDDFAAWIDILLDPNVSKRPSSAAEALALLKNGAEILALKQGEIRTVDLPARQVELNTVPQTTERVVIWRENGDLFLRDDAEDPSAYYGFIFPAVLFLGLFLPFLPKLAVLAMLLLTSGLAWWRWREQNTFYEVRLSRKDGLTIQSGEDSVRVPFVALNGPALSWLDSKNDRAAVSFHTRDGKKHRVIRITKLPEARWVEQQLRVWLLENRDA